MTTGIYGGFQPQTIYVSVPKYSDVYRKGDVVHDWPLIPDGIAKIGDIFCCDQNKTKGYLTLRVTSE